MEPLGDQICDQNIVTVLLAPLKHLLSIFVSQRRSRWADYVREHRECREH